MSQSIELVNTSEIVPGDNDRRTFNQRQLKELASSIDQNGLAQPITVRPMIVCDECGHMVPEAHGQPSNCPKCEHGDFSSIYQIVAGERRFRACSTILNWETIPSIVRELDNEQADDIMLAENVQRVDLNPVDEGHAYQKRMERHGWTVAHTARVAHVSEGRVKNRLSLLKLRPDIQKLVGDGHLKLGFAEEMSVLDNNRQMMAMQWLQQQKSIPGRRTFAAMVGELYQQQCQESLFDLDNFFGQQVVDAVNNSATGRLCDILPRISGLPELPERQRGIGHVLDAYIAELLQDGHPAEAKVLIDFWAKLVGANYANISPFESQTLAAIQGVGA